MGLEIAAILYVDDIVDGDGRYLITDPAALPIASGALLEERRAARIDRSVSVSASEELRSELCRESKKRPRRGSTLSVEGS